MHIFGKIMFQAVSGMNIKSFLLHFVLPGGGKNPALNHFKDGLPLRVYTLVCVRASMTSFSSRHLRRTMEKRRREGDDEEEEERWKSKGGVLFL